MLVVTLLDVAGMEPDKIDQVGYKGTLLESMMVRVFWLQGK